MYLIIEKEREVATTQKMMKKLLQGKFKAPELEVVASEKRLVRNEYHPKLKKFDKHKGMNHEIAEQSFNVLNGYKYTTRKMSYCI